MKHLRLQRRTAAILAVIVPLLALFVHVALRSGPLAPVAVTVARVEDRALAPALFGVGTVAARHTHRIGPTAPGRILRLDVDAGDRVAAGQVLGEMDPVELDARVRAQDAACNRAEAALREADARLAYARTQARRYEKLFAVRSASEEAVATKRQELEIAAAARAAARETLAGARSEREALLAQRRDLRLVAPAAGVVAVRAADPGTTVVAGQAVLEVIDPASVWIDVRFDQIGAAGLAAGQQAQVVLRSHSGAALRGHVLRVEPVADAVTEELLAKIVLDRQPEPLPPLGELAEVTVALPALASGPVVPTAAIRHAGGAQGVWRIADGGLQWLPVTLGAADLDGRIQVRAGLASGDRIVLYSEQALNARSRIRLVERIPGAPR